MKSFLNKGKFNVFLIFLILAISTSLVGKLTSSYDKDILFKIVVTDQPSDKVIFNKSHDSVMLKLRGYGFSLAKYYIKTPELKISTKKLKEFKNAYLWNQKENLNDTRLNFDSSVEILTISDDSIFLYFDQYISQKKYIKANVSVNFDSGFDNFKSPILSNDSVSILGPKDVVTKISLVETETVKLNNVDSDISIELNLLKPGFDNLSLDLSSVSFNLDVDQYTEETVSVPVNIISNNETEFNYYPKEILIKYFISIEDYKKTSPLDFRIDCVFDDSQNYLIPELTKKPDYIKNARLSSNQIQLIILE
tara:strand:- start:12204 stop:13127 length:924 start_codon:yes stop_codon:yes gene_type:complete